MPDRYDIAILGSGLAGSMLATVLARHGVRVVLIEAGMHPRFAIGESLIPETTLRFKLIARRYDVPELADLGTFHAIRDKISAGSGVKRSFAFSYHREGEEARGDECHELPTLTPPVGPDAHLFRQEVDAWLMALAARYGADVKQRTRITDFDLREDGVTLHVQGGGTLEAKYLVDASGFGSPVAKAEGLRDADPRFRTDTRCLFTHMVDVPPYEAVGPTDHGMPVPMSQSTLHHCFDGGWIWVIPFDNHAHSTNPLCSVGLILDRRKHPETGLDAETEFRQIIARYPTVARHFEHARAVRPWISTGRLQYSSHTTVGDRYCLMPHAASFIDPLYSSGLSVSSFFIDHVAGHLIHAVAEDDWSPQPFLELHGLTKKLFDHYDRIIAGSFDAWRSFETWNAWQRIWGLCNIMGAWGPLNRLVRYERSGDRAILDESAWAQNMGLLSSQHDEVVAVVDQAQAALEAAVAREITPAEMEDRVLKLLGGLDFFPSYLRLGDRTRRYNAIFTLVPAGRILLWYRFFAPEKWRSFCYFGFWNYAALTLKWVLGYRSRSAGRLHQGLRDILTGWNQDWRKTPASRVAPRRPAGRTVTPAVAPDRSSTPLARLSPSR